MPQKYLFTKQDTVRDIFSPEYSIDVETNDLKLFLFLEEGIEKLIS